MATKRASDIPQPASRRRMLQALGVTTIGASLIPKQWSKPMIDSVMLPAHAMTSQMPMAVLEGVIDGDAGTMFVVDASASTGQNLSFLFSVSGNCSLVSQAGSMATVQRGVIDGTYTVSVTVTNPEGSDTAMASAEVIDGPPPPPTT